MLILQFLERNNLALKLVSGALSFNESVHWVENIKTRDLLVFTANDLKLKLDSAPIAIYKRMKCMFHISTDPTSD